MARACLSYYKIEILTRHGGSRRSGYPYPLLLSIRILRFV